MSIIGSSNILQNKSKNVAIALTDGGDCQWIGAIYLVGYKKHNENNIVKTTETLSKRISNPKYDIFKRPSNNKLVENFNKKHDLQKSCTLTS